MPGLHDVQAVVYRFCTASSGVTALRTLADLRYLHGGLLDTKTIVEEAGNRYNSVRRL
jgi:hypothetical protein